MKFTIILSSLIIGVSIYLSTDKYEFHYQGNEYYSNEYVIYKMNKESGQVTRLEYGFYDDELSEKQVEQVSEVNMDTGIRYTYNVE